VEERKATLEMESESMVVLDRVMQEREQKQKKQQ
jgi:hypothetical protein